MKIRFFIVNLPPCRDWKGVDHPQRFGVTWVGVNGLRWDGGEFLTREEALAAGESFKEALAGNRKRRTA